jgi:uncharacterized protein YbaA (DUF1428 family)
MSYVDGYVVAVPTARQEDYRRIAAAMACWADDVPEGKVTSFPMAVKRTEDESVVFAWIEWPSREARDAGMKAAMEDERMPSDMSQMPFDGQRGVELSCFSKSR